MTVTAPLQGPAHLATGRYLLAGFDVGVDVLEHWLQHGVVAHAQVLDLDLAVLGPVLGYLGGVWAEGGGVSERDDRWRRRPRPLLLSLWLLAQQLPALLGFAVAGEVRSRKNVSLRISCDLRVHTLPIMHLDSSIWLYIMRLFLITTLHY